jgi:hypothetical protein
MEKKTAPEMVAQRYRMGSEDAREWFGGVRWNTDGRMDTAVLEGVVKALVDAGMVSDVKDVDGAIERLFWIAHQP